MSSAYICGNDAALGSGATDDDYSSGADQFFLVIMGALVFFMQAGFAMLEAGSTGMSSVTSVLFKNMSDVLVGAVAWWACGYAFAYGTEYKFIGSEGFFLIDVGLCDYAYWFYQWTFAATAVTIVSGAMAGRTKLSAYIVYATVITGFVYPVIVHWTWSGNAWLFQGNDYDDDWDGIGYTDFAGSGIVHMTGGVAALVGAYWVGPRGTTEFENYEKKSDIPGHSMPLVALGTFILFFGFIGFNGGSVLSADADAMPVMSLAVVNTVVAAAGGGIAAEAIYFISVKGKYWSLMQMCNGAIAGMVSICAGASLVYPWAGFCIGVGGGVFYKLTSFIVIKLGIDDAIDAAAVHMGAGFWGLIGVALFAMDVGQENAIAGHTVGGVFYDGDKSESWNRLGWNVAGALVISAWTGILCTIMFASLHYLDLLRIDDHVLNSPHGLDYEEHGEMAYVHHRVSNERRHDSIDPGLVGSFEGSYTKTQL